MFAAVVQWTEVCLRRSPVKVETIDRSGRANLQAPRAEWCRCDGGWDCATRGGQRIYLKRVREGSRLRPNVVVTNGACACACAWALELFSGAALSAGGGSCRLYGTVGQLCGRAVDCCTSEVAAIAGVDY